MNQPVLPRPLAVRRPPSPARAPAGTSTRGSLPRCLTSPQTRSRSTAQYDSVGSFRSRLPQKSLISNRRNSGGRSRKKTTVPRRRERERRGEGRRSTRTQPQALRAAGPLERRRRGSRRECGARRCSRVGAWLSRELGVEAAVEIWRSLTSRTVRAPASLRYACRPRQ